MKRNKLSKFRRRNERQAYLMIAPQIIGFFVFSIYPILWVFRYAFYRYDGVSEVFIGLENFIRAFTRDKNFWTSVINTFIIAYGKLIIEIPLTFITAVMMSSSLIRFRRIFNVAYYLPQVTGNATACLIFTFLFATVNGNINNILENIGLISGPVSWLSDKWTAIIVISCKSLWAGFASNVLLFMAGVQNISEEVIEASRIDGASRLQGFAKITVPMLAPQIKVVLMLAMINGVKTYEDVMLITNGGPAEQTNVAMLYIYKLFFETTGIPEYGYASALGVIMSIIIGIITVVYLKVTKKADSVM